MNHTLYHTNDSDMKGQQMDYLAVPLDSLSGFTKSKEGVAEYEKLGLPYPSEILEEEYEQWLKKTTAENLNKYTKCREKEILTIVRLKGGDDKEYITYSFLHRRLDEALNVNSRWRPKIGLYPIPKPIYKVTIGSFGKQSREISEIQSIENGYGIPFSKKKMDELRSKIGLSSDGKVSYALQPSNGVHLAVASFEDLRDTANRDKH